MQTITYKDGTKTKERFNSLPEALDDAKKKGKKKPIKKVEVKLVIPHKRKKRK